jgi:hypothetical protein
LQNLQQRIPLGALRPAELFERNVVKGKGKGKREKKKFWE